MARFFIDRPVFAWVIAIIIMLAGALAIKTLPVSQYPQIAPPQIAINAMYPGASAQTVQDTVTQVIEQKMNGIDNLIYMASSSDSAGAVSIALTFAAGTDPNVAQVQVQNKLQLAIPLLPQIVQRSGIQVVKSTRNFLVIVGLVSEDGSMNRFDLSDYAVSSVQDIISRVEGVGEVMIFGSQNAMRIWLDAARLHEFRLTPADVVAALQAQNAQVSAGQFGGTPAEHGQQLNATITARSLLQTPEQFGAVILRTNPDGSTVRLREVARCEVGTENYDMLSRYQGKPATGLAVRLAAGANALSTADRIKAKMEELSRFFPPGMKVIYPFDTTPFVRISIEEVVQTLVEAIGLVFLVMFVFLQNFRATLIPTIAVPVVLLGTFGVLSAAGFSINTLTMFAMVLAIGLLVDDAIVVVENVERIMSEEGLPPREATIKSMGQITGALWGIALVLSAVFVPMAFFGGSTGVIYRQFAITIVSAMVLSVLIAMILTPALCATLLKPVAKGHVAAESGWFSWFFRWFNRWFERGSGGYRAVVARMLGGPWRHMLVYAGVVAAMAVLFLRLPTAFLPDEDQGFIVCQVQLPAGATQERALKVIEQLERHFMENEKAAVDSVLTISGFSFAGRGQNMGLAFVKLRDWKLRRTPELRAPAVARRAMGAFSRIRDGMVFAFVPPPVTELGTANGFDFQLQDRGGIGHERLLEARNQLLGLAAKNPALVAVRPNGQDDTSQFRLDIDDVRAGALGVSAADANSVISTAWGGAYIGDFVQNGRVKKVYVQADARDRMLPEDLGDWHVRSGSGEMVPFSAFTTTRWDYGSPRLERYNGMPSMEIMGQAAPGLELRRGDEGDGEDGRPAPRRRRLRVDRPLLRGAGGRRPGPGALRDLAAGGLPLPRGPLRELGGPVLGHARRAARRRRRGAGVHVARLRERRLLPDRDPDDDRPLGEERDPDRGVRQGADGARDGADRGDARGRPAAPAADPDDLPGLLLRRAAAGAQQGGRLGRPERHGHRGQRRHGDRHGPRDLLRPRLLRGGAPAVPGEGAGGGVRNCRDSAGGELR